MYAAFGFRDTHGMTNSFTWGFDGWVYACHGFSNTSQVKGKDDRAITMQSGNTYRLKPDGSHVEWLTHGQVNPFGLAFDPLGNLYSADCHSRPIYQLLRGAYYPSFGKPHDGLGFGPEMINHGHGSTAILSRDMERAPRARSRCAPDHALWVRSGNRQEGGRLPCGQAAPGRRAGSRG